MYILKPFVKIQQNLASVMIKKLLLLSLFIIFCTLTHAQYASWMKGTWKSAGGASIKITDVSRESFTGIKTIGSTNVAISGGFRGKGMYLQDGAIVNADGKATSQQYDCAACSQDSKIVVSHDSLIWITSIADCDNKCNGQTIYYRLFSEYDDDAQHFLVDRFGRPADIIGFHPYQPKEGTKVQSLDDDNSEPAKTEVAAVTMTPDPDALKQKAKNHQDSLDNAARLKQQKLNDAALLAQQKKREKAISDSLNLVQQKDKQRLKDSLNNVAKLEKIKQHTEDSLRDAEAKKRQLEIADSIKLAQQNKQQRIKDSLDNLAKLRQQQISDSTQLALQRKREKQIADSLNLAQQKEQQRIKDSLDNVARLEKIRLKTEDSLRDVAAKKRQQEIADSISLANQKEQQRIKDSLQMVAAANLQKQRTADSLLEVQAKLRQQQISDSLAAIHKQQYNDSLQKAALAKAAPPPTKGSPPSATDKALTSRTNVLLQTYHITTPDILIELFDNGDIDGDRVSVYHNNEIIVSNQTLGLKAITVNVHADSSNREHEFVLVAENLGSIPPNSALMRITAGKQTYKLSVNTDLKTNARIVFIYDGK